MSNTSIGMVFLMVGDINLAKKIIFENREHKKCLIAINRK
jgi:hypothetical protein